MEEARRRRGRADDPDRAAVVFPTFVLFSFADLMLHGRHLTLHIPELHTSGRPTRSIEKINQTARCGANQDDEETHRPDERSDALINVAELRKQDLKHFFAPTNPRQADRERRNRALNWHNRKEIDEADAS